MMFSTVFLCLRMTPHHSRVKSWALIFVPPLLLATLLLAFGSWNVVWGDGVSMCPIFDKYYRSTLTFYDLWEPYQGHRILFHRLAELLLGLVTHWNTNYEIGFIILMLLVDFALICVLLQELRNAVTGRAWYLLVGVCSLALFSTSQLGNLVNGFQMGLIMSLTSVLLGIVCLTKFELSYGALGVCIAAGVVASYSFGNGFAYWIASTPPLIAKLRIARHRWAKAMIWVTAAIVTIFLYFYKLGGNGTAVSITASIVNVFRTPLFFMAYLCTCLGAPIFFLNGAKALFLPAPMRLMVSFGAPVCGIIGLCLFGYLIFLWWKRGCPSTRLLAPWLALGIYALLSVGLTSLARFSTSLLMSAIASRYISYSQYFWLSLFVFAVVIKPDIKRAQVVSIGALLVIGYLISYANGLRQIIGTSAQLKQVRADLLSGRPTAQTYFTINTDRDPDEVERYVDILRQHRLATFHSVKAP